jgi:UDP-N-acetylglucosamine:LPS N-acetylglucosamine transferase
VLANASAAEVIDQAELSGARLADLVGRLLSDRPRLAAMGQAMHGFARPDAAARIVDRLLELVNAAGEVGARRASLE